MTIRPFPFFSFCVVLLGLGLVLVCPGTLKAQGAAPALSEEFARWTVNGSVMHQFQSDLDRGGNFSVTRFFINGRWSHPVNSNLSLGIGLRYAYEDYSFSDTVGFSGKPPWGEIHMPDLSLAASRKFGPDLTLGLGAGIYRRFEETSFFPLIFVKWKISEQWSVGNALQAGPTGPAGLELLYRPGEDWAFGLGGAYRSVRFRLDRGGMAPDGIGTEKSFPVWLRATRRLAKTLNLDLYGGLLPGGELRIEDSSGRELRTDNYQTTPFMALSFSWRI